MSPTILVVNPSNEFERVFYAESAASYFEENTACTVYKRPFEPNHPRMKLCEDPFDVVVIDLAGWMATRSQQEINACHLPDWLTRDFIETCETSCIVIVSPKECVHAVLNKLMGLGTRRTNVRVSACEPDQMNLPAARQRVAAEIRFRWQEWQIMKRQKSFWEAWRP